MLTSLYSDMKVLEMSCQASFSSESTFLPGTNVTTLENRIQLLNNRPIEL